MPKGMRKCKICGKLYEYCKTNRPAGIFRFQDVACCPEHATIYFAKIAESRSNNSLTNTEESSAAIANFTDTPEDEDDDELFDEEFDDEDEESEIEL